MTLPEWKLPSGTSRGLWAYLNDSRLSDQCDARLRGTALLQIDLRFAEQFFSRPGSLIDLGCGTGRIAIPFAQRGFQVLGVDLSPHMLRVAGAKAIEANVELPLVRANLVELDAVRDRSFEYATCLFSTLGMVMGADNRRSVLEHAHRILKPGGLFLLHVHNLWFHLYNSAGRRWLLRDRLGRLRRKADFGDFEMPAHEGIAGLALHHFSRREIKLELRKAGFQIEVIEPVSLRSDGKLPRARWFPGLRAYGFLIVARRAN